MTSIGELNERSLHRALKERYAVAGSETERVVDGFVTDVVADGRIVEIQTGGFGPLRNKLSRLLDAYPVTLVHPIARDRYIVKMADDQAQPPTRRRSPKHGSVFDVFSTLVSIPSLLAHPNLTLEVVMTVEEEVRAPSETPRTMAPRLDPRRPPARGRCRDARDRVDGRPVRPGRRPPARHLHDERHRVGDGVIAEPGPEGPRFCFREGGVIEICGKDGNTLVYRRTG